MSAYLRILVIFIISFGATSSSALTYHSDIFDEWPAPEDMPSFDNSVPTNFTGLVGKTVKLLCKVKNLKNLTVSWVRHRDVHLLTVGRYTYTSDQRFESIHYPQSEDWTLKIRYPQRKDSGTYECQISLTPPIGRILHLNIVDSITFIVGEPDLFVNKGSTINLTCVIKYAPEPTQSINWSHNGQLINFDSPRGGVSLVTEKGADSTSRLLIQNASIHDSGIYTCEPSNANTGTIKVHVVNDKHPAAMHHGDGSSSYVTSKPTCFIIIIMANVIFL